MRSTTLYGVTSSRNSPVSRSHAPRVGGCQPRKVLHFAAHFPLRRHFLGGDAHAVRDREFSSRSKIAGLNAGLLPPIGTNAHALRCRPRSSPSASPRRIRSAASATACTPEEQKRLMVMPETPSGKSCEQQTDARHVHALPPLRAIAQPMITSSTAPGSSPGHLSTAAFSTCARRSSGRTFLSIPRGALPTAVRVAATM